MHDGHIPRHAGPTGSPEGYQWICQFHEKPGTRWLVAALFCYISAAVIFFSYVHDDDTRKLALAIGLTGLGTLWTSGMVQAWHRPHPRVEQVDESNALLLAYSGWTSARLIFVGSLGIIGIALVSIGLLEHDFDPILFAIPALFVFAFLIYRITSDRSDSYMVFSDEYLKVLTRDSSWEIEWQAITAIYGAASSRKGDIYLRCLADGIATPTADTSTSTAQDRVYFGDEIVKKISASDWNCHPNSLLSTLVFISEMQDPRKLPSYAEIVQMLDSPDLTIRRRLDRSRIR